MTAGTPVEVHVVDLDDPVGEVGCLSAGELERAARFRSARDAHRFRAGRVAVRHVVAARSGADPGQLRFDTGEFGKPTVVGVAGLHFSFSNTGGTGVVAVAGVPVGVDAEQAPADLGLDDVAATFFAPAEVAAVLRGPAAERRAAFLRCWTRKEAVVKADGRGLQIALDRFVVSVAEHEPPAVLVSTDDRLGPARAWALADLSRWTPPGVTAALAARAPALLPVLRTPTPWGADLLSRPRREEGALP